MAHSDTQRDGSGAFDKDRERASEAGRKGGEHGGQRQQSKPPGAHRQMGGGTFAQNPERPTEASREGGRTVPDGHRSVSQDRDLASDAVRKSGQR